MINVVVYSLNPMLTNEFIVTSKESQLLMSETECKRKQLYMHKNCVRLKDFITYETICEWSDTDNSGLQKSVFIDTIKVVLL